MSDQIRNNVFESVKLYPSALQHIYSFLYWSSELKDTICSCDKHKQKYYQPMGERQSAKLEKKSNLIVLQRGRSVNVSQIALLCALNLKRIGRNITA